MPTFGLTSSGFVPKQQSDILSDIQGQEQTNISATIDLDPDQPLGQINGIFSGKIAECWEVLNTLYGIIDPDQAEGAALVNVCKLTGTVKDPASYSTVECTVNLNAATALPVGALANVTGQPGNTWTAVQNPALPAGQAAYNGATGATGVTGVTFQATTTGPVAASAGTLTQINAPVTGWNSITNPSDAILGSFTESDTSLRQKRLQELGASGGSTVDKIRAVLLNLTLANGTFPVISCTVYENETDFTDVNGLPPHSVEALIYDQGALNNDVVAQAIWNVKGSGAATYGNAFGTATDSQGTTHIVNFSRPTTVPIYLAYTTTPGTLTAAQTAAIKSLVATEASAFLVPGASVIALQLRALPLAPEPGAVTGITDVPSLALGTAPAPGGTSNITIGIRQVATLSTTNITVNGV